jgi:hypothetical protein
MMVEEREGTIKEEEKRLERVLTGFSSDSLSTSFTLTTKLAFFLDYPFGIKDLREQE